MGNPRQHHGQVDIVLQIEGIQQIELLEHKAQIVPPEIRHVLFPDFGDVHILQQHRSGSWPIQRRQDVQKRGLSGAGFAHNGHIFSLLHREVYIPQSLHAVSAEAGGVYLFQMFNR